MLYFSRSIAVFFPLAAFLSPAQAEPTAEVKLLAPSSAVLGSTVEVALELTPAETLHVYYINPGEMGQAVELTWSDLPAGITAGELRFPVPHRVKTGELATHGYEETTRFFTALTVAPSMDLGTYQLRARASWLACNDEKCLTGEKALTLNLKILAQEDKAVGESLPELNGLALIPVEAASDWKSSLQREGENWLIDLTAPADWKAPATKLDAFSETSDFFKPGDLPAIVMSEKGLRISAKASEYSDGLSTALLVLAGVTPPLRIPLQLPAQKSQE